MHDPWLLETLEELQTLIGKTRRGIRAIAVFSNSETEDGVRSALREKFSDLEVIDADLAAVEFPQEPLDSIFQQPPCPRLIFVRGLARVVDSSTKEADASVPEILGWINRHRESFDHPGEKFIFFSDEETDEALSRWAPDFYRYTQRFDFTDWEDLLEKIERKIDASDLLSDRTSPREKLRALQDHEQWLADHPASSRMLIRNLLDQSSNLQESAEFAEAKEKAERALSLAEELEDSRSIAQALRTLASATKYLGKTSEALNYLHHALEMSRADDNLVALVYDELAFIQRNTGRLTEAENNQRRSLEIYSRMGNETSKRLMHRSLAWLAVDRGDLRGAAREIKLASANPETSNNLYFRIEILRTHGWLHSWTGETRAAIHCLDEALTLAKKADLSNISQITLMTFGLLNLGLGRPDAARRIFEQLLDGSPKSFNTLSFAQLILARILIVLGDRARAHALLDKNRQALDSTEYRKFVASNHHAQALLDLAENDLSAAQDHLQFALSEFETMGFTLYTAEARRDLARLHRLRGDLDAAAEFAATALATNHEAGARPAEARDLIEFAFLDLAQGNPELARTHARQAMTILRETRTRLDEPAAEAAHAVADERLGEKASAEARHARWRRLVDGMEAHGLRRIIEQSIAAT